MSLNANIKNTKYYYPPIGKVRNSNNIHLTDINMIRGLKIKKNLNHQINSRKVIRNLHLNKTNSYSNISNQINKKDLYIQDSTDASLILNTKNRANSKKDKSSYHDAETLYEININLKREINKLKKEIMLIKAEIQRKDNELIKKDKLLQTAFDKGIDDNIEINTFLNNNDNNNLFLEKDIKKNNYITKFRKQYNELKNKYNEKIEEISELKKNIKTTKLNELKIQNKETFKEFNKLKELYTNIFEENKINLEKIKKLNDTENELNEKNSIILQLQESLKLSSTNNIKNENEIEKLKKIINRLQNENQILQNKLKTLFEHYNKKNELKESNPINNIFELNEELSLHPKKIKNGITFNNTNRSYLHINKINIERYENNKRKMSNISPLSNKYLNESKDSSNKKKDNSINNKVNLINNNLNKDDNEKNFNNNDEEENISNKNEKLENKNGNNDTSQTMYILIKNFEIMEISREDALTLIIKPILNDISNEKQIKNETLINMFTNKISSLINCSNNNNDINSISNLINSLLSESHNDLFDFIKSFLEIFDNIKIYKDNTKEGNEIIKRINEALNKYKEYFINAYNNEYISFIYFRSLLNDKNIILDDEDIEYLIYLMKKDCNKEKQNLNQNENNLDKQNNINEEKIEKKEMNIDKNCSIFDLNYKTFLDIIK